MFKKKLVGLVVLSLCLGCKATAPVKTGQGEPRMPGKLYASLDGTATNGTVSSSEQGIHGVTTGTGTYFQITDSQYLNITLDSSVPIKLALESVPEIVMMDIASTSEAASAVITIGGLASNTAYFKYEGDYQNIVEFTTDANGGYTYTQDLSRPYTVYIRPKL